VVVSAQHPLEKIPCAEAKARAPNLEKELSTPRKGISELDEGLIKELLCAIRGETLLTDQYVTYKSQTRALSQESEGSQERGRVLGGAGWKMGPAESAEMNQANAQVGDHPGDQRAVFAL